MDHSKLFIQLITGAFLQTSPAVSEILKRLQKSKTGNFFHLKAHSLKK